MYQDQGSNSGVIYEGRARPALNAKSPTQPLSFAIIVLSSFLSPCFAISLQSLFHHFSVWKPASSRIQSRPYSRQLSTSLYLFYTEW
jgi:hypothetical protein